MWIWRGCSAYSQWWGRAWTCLTCFFSGQSNSWPYWEMSQRQPFASKSILSSELWKDKSKVWLLAVWWKSRLLYCWRVMTVAEREDGALSEGQMDRGLANEPQTSLLLVYWPKYRWACLILISYDQFQCGQEKRLKELQNIQPKWIYCISPKLDIETGIAIWLL